MAAITGTKGALTEFAGQKKILVITATLESASDTITLTEAAHGVGTIHGIIGAVMTAGQDAECQGLQVSYTGLVITVVSKNAAGAASSAWTTTTVSISLVVS